MGSIPEILSLKNHFVFRTMLLAQAKPLLSAGVPGQWVNGFLRGFLPSAVYQSGAPRNIRTHPGTARNTAGEIQRPKLCGQGQIPVPQVPSGSRLYSISASRPTGWPTTTKESASGSSRRLAARATSSCVTASMKPFRLLM